MSINILGEHTLTGQEAIEALYLYIEELENQKATGIPNAHVNVQIKVARALCQAIRSSEEATKTDERSIEPCTSMTMTLTSCSLTNAEKLNQTS